MHPNGTDPTYAPGEVAAALDAARELIAAGVPVFVAPPCPPGCEREGHEGSAGTMGSGFDLPGRWQQSSLDPAAPDRWAPGAALCAVMGHTLDLIDVDPRNRGDARQFEALGLLPYIHAEALTPSGGVHLFATALGVGSLDGKIAPGIDLKGGNADGSGRGFAFIAPTVRTSKVDGAIHSYRWVTDRAPDAESIAAEAPGDRSGDELAERVRSLRPDATFHVKHDGVVIEDDGLGDPVIPWAQAVKNMNDAYAAFHDLDPATGSGFNAALNAAAFIVGKYVPAVCDYPRAAALLYAAAEHNGCVRRVGPRDYRPMGAAAVRATIASGLAAGMMRPNAVGPGEPRNARELSEDGLSDDPATGVSDERSTWEPQDVSAVLDGTYVPQVPELLVRDDGAALFYRGLLHSLHGESESGKSMVAQIACAQTLAAGGTALYVDFESDVATVVSRIRLMGVPDGAIRERFSYVRPDTRPDGDDRAAYAALLARAWDISVVDGVTEAMGVWGVESSSDNDQVAHWVRTFPRRLATRTGAAVVLIDHQAKSADSRGRFAIGAQAKMAGLDGAGYVVEVRQVIGRGLRGAVSLRVAKDRPGGVRPRCGAWRAGDRTQEAAYVVIDSTGDEQRIRFEIRPPAVDTDTRAVLMEAASRHLEARPVPLSQNAIVGGVSGNERDVRIALNALIAAGFVAMEKGPRNAILHRSVRPFRVDIKGTAEDGGSHFGHEDIEDRERRE